MGLVLGIDLGTSFVKAALFELHGTMLGLARIAVPRLDQGPRCELTVDTFWNIVSDAIGECLASAGADPASVHALSYASQANSFVLLDTTGQPLTPLILWPDRRATSLSDRSDLWRCDHFLDTTGVGLVSDEFCPHKLDWFRRRQPSLWAATASILSISDFLVFGLTGARIGDRSTASMTGLWDQRREQWWTEALRQLQIPETALAMPLRTGSVAQSVAPAAARRLRLAPDTLVVVGALDHYAAAVGAGLGTLADASESTGTVLACVSMAQRYAPQPGVCVGPAQTPGAYYCLGFTDSGTGLLDRYHAQYMPDRSLNDVVRMAEDAPVGAAGLRATAGRDQSALDDLVLDRGALYEPRHHVRAILEANALALSRLLAALPSGRPERIVATGGGARSETWLQLKADVLGIDVLQVDCEEPACQGAALFAASALAHQNESHAFSPRGFVHIKRCFRPDPAHHTQYAALARQRERKSQSTVSQDDLGEDTTWAP